MRFPDLKDTGASRFEESALWAAEQDRLAKQWRTQLGLVPLSSDPTVLTWHASYVNQSIKQSLARWGHP